MEILNNKSTIFSNFKAQISQLIWTEIPKFQQLYSSVHTSGEYMVSYSFQGVTENRPPLCFILVELIIWVETNSVIIVHI
jgi:hypothetical protein